MSKRNWLVEDNLVAIYIALHGCNDLKYNKEEIQEIIHHKCFPMRPQQFVAVGTKGAKGLCSGLQSRMYKELKELYNMFKNFSQKKFARLVNYILSVKSRGSRSSKPRET